MQAGNRIVKESDGIFSSTLNDAPPNPEYNLASILKFYIAFADPNNKDLYSWNKSFPSSIDAFSREDLAFYFGYASELESLVNRNPNQNFGVAPFPQIKNSNFKLTGSRVTGVALLASSKNFNTAFTAVTLPENMLSQPVWCQCGGICSKSNRSMLIFPFFMIQPCMRGAGSTHRIRIPTTFSAGWLTA